MNFFETPPQAQPQGPCAERMAAAVERERLTPRVSWELCAIEQRNLDETLAEEVARLRRLQLSLLSCLDTGEKLVFRVRRRRSGRLDWGIEFQSPAANNVGTNPSTRALTSLLGVFSSGLHFKQLRAGRIESSCAWLELTPSLIELPEESRRIGFHAEADSLEAPTLVPALGQLGSLLPSLADLIRSAVGIEGLEVSMNRWNPPAGWHAMARELRGARHSLSDVQLANALDARVTALERDGGWTVGCRVRLQTGPQFLGPQQLLGRIVFGGAASLSTTGPSEVQSPGLAAAIPTGELPLLLPCHRVLYSSGLPLRYRSPAGPLATNGPVIGKAGGRKVRIPDAGRSRHTYIVGATGTGKSTLLANLIRQDMERGEGVILLDPHGDLYSDVLSMVPASRSKDLITLDPLGSAPVPGFNPLRVEDTQLADLRMTFVIGELFHLIENLFDMRSTGGPVFEMYFRNTLKLLMTARVEPHPTLLDFSRVLVEPDYRKSLLDNCPDQRVVGFWRNQAEKVAGEAALQNMAPYIASKLDGLTSSAFLRTVVAAKENTLKTAELMDRRRILLVNLDKGLLGMTESKILGALLMTDIFAAALGRSRTPVAERSPVRLYIDEFQDFISDGVASMLSEARKFGLCLTLANQTFAQLEANPGKKNLLHAVLGNVGNLISFRLGVPDAERLQPFTAPFPSHEMQRLPNFHGFCRLLGRDGPMEPMVVSMMRPTEIGSRKPLGLARRR